MLCHCNKSSKLNGCFFNNNVVGTLFHCHFQAWHISLSAPARLGSVGDCIGNADRETSGVKTISFSGE